MIINYEEETRFNNSIFDHNKQTSFKINFIKGDKAKKNITFLGQNKNKKWKYRQ